MKMKTGTRVLFTLFLIVIILACLFIIATIAGFVSQSYLQDATYTMTSGSLWFKVLYIAIAAVLIIVAFILMFFGTGKTTPKTAKIAVFEIGSISITVKAIEELIEKYVREFKDVKGLRTKVTSFDSFISIAIEIATLPEANLPELTKELQTGLKDNIQQHTGINVKETKIMIMEIDDKAKTKVQEVK